MKTLKFFAFGLGILLSLMSGVARATCTQTAGPDAGTTTWESLYSESLGATCFEVTADAGSDLSFFVGDDSTAATWLYLINGPDVSYLSTAGVPAGTEFRLDYSDVAGGVYNGIIYFTGVSDSRLVYGATITTAVPEPSTYALMLAGLAAVGFTTRRRRAIPLPS